MSDHTAAADVPDDPAARPPEQFRPGLDNLRQRLERLADGHPSSQSYRIADHDRAGSREDTAHIAGRERIADGGRAGHLELDRRDASAGSGWQALDVRDHPSRPAERDIHITADRAGHILDGDPDKDGGGHRHGTGRPGKTEFPQDWSDDYIRSVVEDVSGRPDAAEWQPNGRWRVTGGRAEIRVTAVVLVDGRIWTAWPEPGGKGVRQNPEAS